ncbi:MAG: ABC transporter permease, partial [Burkholderiales bacterium]|nr:ABC transporter permease [Burkholderiales bacterium]
MSAFAAWRDSDLVWRFRHSPVAIVAGIVAVVLIVAALFASWIAPHDPFDLAGLELMDSLLPPAWEAEGRATFLLGTDDQGRDVLSGILYGMRISLIVGVASVLLSMLIGVTLGLVAGHIGGVLDAFLMRVADVQLSFPAILVALLIDGVLRVTLPDVGHGGLAMGVLVLSIGLSGWVQYARTVRGSTLVESRKEYVQAARVIGRSQAAILFRHLLPNVTGPVLV